MLDLRGGLRTKKDPADRPEYLNIEVMLDHK